MILRLVKSYVFYQTGILGRIIMAIRMRHLVALTGDLSSSTCVCGCVVYGVSATTAT